MKELGPFIFEVQNDIEGLILDLKGTYEVNDVYYGFWYIAFLMLGIQSLIQKNIKDYYFMKMALYILVTSIKIKNMEKEEEYMQNWMYMKGTLKMEKQMEMENFFI